MISEQELDNILFKEFSDKTKGEQKRMREDTLDFTAWLEGCGKTWPSAEAYAGYAIERKRRVGKKESQPYEAADKAAARVRAVYEALARQKGENSMTIDFEATPEVEPVHEASQPEDTLEATEATEESEESEATPAPVEVSPVQSVRRGRKQKPEADRRSVKFSIYLTPSLYEGVRLLASARQEEISDVIFSVLNDFVERNRDKARQTRDFFSSLGSIK